MQDIDGNGTVELEEFLQWSIRNKEANGAEQQLRSVFDVFDKNKDGFIDTSELTQVRGRRPSSARAILSLIERRLS